MNRSTSAGRKCSKGKKADDQNLLCQLVANKIIFASAVQAMARKDLTNIDRRNKLADI